MAKISSVTPRARGNPIARNPLMRKGGVHEKSRSAKRQQAKRDLRKQIALFYHWLFSFAVVSFARKASAEAHKAFTYHVISPVATLAPISRAIFNWLSGYCLLMALIKLFEFFAFANSAS